MYIGVMPISYVYTLTDLPARIIFVPLSSTTTTSHIHSMILRVISSSSRFLPLAPYNRGGEKRSVRNFKISWDRGGMKKNAEELQNRGRGIGVLVTKKNAEELQNCGHG